MGQLDVVQDVDGGAVVVCVRGEVDSNTVDQLVSALDDGLQASASAPVRTLVIELANVTYFGSAGLNAVLGCYERGLAEGVAVRVVATNPEVVRPIEVTKLDAVLRPYPSVADALAADAGPP
ncbi:STAS domain-containing protein [Mycolicibacterium rufum]|uniref:Anti-sigma factor antagonist n=1 Tax=Mycolicibacterium rufum TaxID=318424 RepID=A0A9X2YHC9_9MYCO|nr:STAS domain-containing protein [Mycolicibacterium rufum]MCV7073972.1 STAS domain-containing protein [Mycolicibacterium rufum]ULP38496.1 STAS domain-containing protein [Mycolicibacterium rufum]